MNDLHEQRVLAGVEEWDRPAGLLTEKQMLSRSRTKTAEYIQAAKQMLEKARRATRHRRLRKESPIHSSLTRAIEACERAYEECYAAGEAYDEAAD